MGSYFPNPTRGLRRCGPVLALCLVPWVMIGKTCHGARPLLTDDAQVLGPGECQVETWVQRTARTEQLWLLPACVVSGANEWALGGRAASSGYSGHSEWLGQYKTVWRSVGPGRTGGAIALGAGRSEGQSFVYMNLPLTWRSASEPTAIHVNAGWIGPVASKRPGWMTWGVASELRVSPDLWGIVERYHPSPDRTQFQAGLRWWIVPSKLQLDATLGQLREGGMKVTSATAGLRWIFTLPS